MSEEPLYPKDGASYEAALRRATEEYLAWNKIYTASGKSIILFSRKHEMDIDKILDT